MKNWAIWAFIFAGLLFVAYFHSGPQQQPVELTRDSAPLEKNRVIRFDKPAPQFPVAQPTPTFGGYPCSPADCSEDKAGYRWAEQNGITDPDSCTGNTGAFIDGCRVYARQRAAGSAARGTARPASDANQE